MGISEWKSGTAEASWNAGCFSPVVTEYLGSPLMRYSEPSRLDLLKADMALKCALDQERSARETSVSFRGIKLLLLLSFLLHLALCIWTGHWWTHLRALCISYVAFVFFVYSEESSGFFTEPGWTSSS